MSDEQMGDAAREWAERAGKGAYAVFDHSVFGSSYTANSGSGSLDWMTVDPARFRYDPNAPKIQPDSPLKQWWDRMRHRIARRIYPEMDEY